MALQRACRCCCMCKFSQNSTVRLDCPRIPYPLTVLLHSWFPCTCWASVYWQPFVTSTLCYHTMAFRHYFVTCTLTCCCALSFANSTPPNHGMSPCAGKMHTCCLRDCCQGMAGCLSERQGAPCAWHSQHHSAARLSQMASRSSAIGSEAVDGECLQLMVAACRPLLWLDVALTCCE